MTDVLRDVISKFLQKALNVCQTTRRHFYVITGLRISHLVKLNSIHILTYFYCAYFNIVFLLTWVGITWPVQRLATAGRSGVLTPVGPGIFSIPVETGPEVHSPSSTRG